MASSSLLSFTPRTYTEKNRDTRRCVKENWVCQKKNCVCQNKFGCVRRSHLCVENMPTCLGVSKRENASGCVKNDTPRCVMIVEGFFFF